jgi:hypothetical protein
LFYQQSAAFGVKIHPPAQRQISPASDGQKRYVNLVGGKRAVTTLQFEIGLVGWVVEAHVSARHDRNLAEPTPHDVGNSRAKESSVDHLVACHHPSMMPVMCARCGDDIVDALTFHV